MKSGYHPTSDHVSRGEHGILFGYHSEHDFSAHLFNFLILTGTDTSSVRALIENSCQKADQEWLAFQANLTIAAYFS
jgi:hypothetical protein